MNHFKEKEFACKCGCGRNKMSHVFLNMLDNARDIAGIPFVINSGYRCQEYNKRIGGVKGSAHTHGVAADIKVSDNRARYLILTALLKAGFNRIGVYSSFIHVDCDVSKTNDVVWRG